jgi:hypothetical protein
MAHRTVTATVIDDCTAETRQRHHRIRIEKLHKMSTRTVDCELFWLQIGGIHKRNFRNFTNNTGTCSCVRKI